VDWTDDIDPYISMLGSQPLDDQVSK